MRKFIVGTIATAITFAIVSYLLPQIDYGGSIPTLIAVSLIAGVVNGLIAPVVKALSMPISMMTMGLFGIVVNAALLLLIAWVASIAKFDFTVGGFPPEARPRRDRGRRRSVPSRSASSARWSAWWSGTERRRRGRRSHRAARPRPDGGGPALRHAGLRHGPRRPRRGVRGGRRRVPGPVAPPVLGQGERRAGGHRRGRASAGSARTSSRAASGPPRDAPASRTSGSRSRGSARPRPTCAPRSGPRPTGRPLRWVAIESPEEAEALAAIARAAGAPPHRRALPAQPGRRAGDAGRAGRRRRRLQVRHDRDRDLARPSSSAAGAGRTPGSGRAASTCTSGRSSAPWTRGARRSGGRWPSPRCGAARSTRSTPSTSAAASRSVRSASPRRRPSGSRASCPRCSTRSRPTGDRRAWPSSPAGPSSRAPAGWSRASSTSATAATGRSSSTPGMTELIRPALYGARHPIHALAPGGAASAGPDRNARRGADLRVHRQPRRPRPAAAPARRPRRDRRCRRVRRVAGVHLQRPAAAAAGAPRRGRHADARPSPGFDPGRVGYRSGVDASARFRERLAQGPLLADGAMGTLLFSRGIPQRAASTSSSCRGPS